MAKYTSLIELIEACHPKNVKPMQGPTKVHVTLFTHTNEGKMIWVRKHPKDSPYPRKFDQAIVGTVTSVDKYEAKRYPKGISARTAIEDTAFKRIVPEEISCVGTLTDRLDQIGKLIASAERDLCIMCTIPIDERASLSPGVWVRGARLMYSAEVPPSFMPTHPIWKKEEEESPFHLMPVSKVLDSLWAGEWKPDSAVVTICFLMEMGIIHLDDEDLIEEFLEKLGPEPAI